MSLATKHFPGVIANLAELKRAIASEGATVELVDVGAPEGKSPMPYHLSALNEPRRVQKRQTNGFYVEPFEGQKTTSGKPMGRTWFEYGPARDWSFTISQTGPEATITQDGWSRTYRIGLEVCA